MFKDLPEGQTHSFSECCKECEEWEPNDKRLSRVSCKHCSCHQEKNESREERLDECIAEIKKQKGDCLWCGLCFRVFYEQDLKDHPERFYRCDKCGMVRDKYCKGPTFDLNVQQVILAERKRVMEEVVNEMKKRYRCAACDGVKCNHTLGCETLSTLSAKIQSMKWK